MSKKDNSFSAINKKYWVGAVFALLGIFLLFAGDWLKCYSLSELLFYASVPLKGSNLSVVRNFVYNVVPVTLIIWAAVLVLTDSALWKKKLSFKLKIRGKEHAVTFLPLDVLYKYMLVPSVCFFIICAAVFCNEMGFPTYIKSHIEKSDIFEREYADPSEMKFNAVGEKRNLICIYLESMESTYADTENNGAFDVSRIPYLTELANENVNFSASEGLGGFSCAPYTTWTSASLISQTSGVPLKSGSITRSESKEKEILKGMTGLGNILEKQGYKQVFMCGSDASYGARSLYFESHGNYEIKDYNYAVKNGILPSDYHEFWGYEDEKLFEYAKEELTELAASGRPFNLTMLTVDTHFFDGYLCNNCGDEFDDCYSNVIACSDKQVYDFIQWIKQQDFYENTVIVIAGDHITMDSSYLSKYNTDRFVYNCILNPAVTAENMKNRSFTAMDMFPTTLAAMGFEWGSDKLGLGVNLFSGSPTLCESMGVDAFFDEIEKSSDYYTNRLAGGE